MVCFWVFFFPVKLSANKFLLSLGLLNWQNRSLEGLVAHLATPLKSLLEGEAKTREDETSHKWRRADAEGLRTPGAS